MYDWYAPINKHIVYPLYYFKNGDKRLTRLAELDRQQHFTLEQLQSLQLQRIQHLVERAFNHSKYYRDVMTKKGLIPSDISQLSDIKALPVLTKNIIQHNLEDLISDQYSKNNLVKDASGGSTGEPTIYYKDWDRHNLRRADQIRHDRWSGWDLGDRSALIWGAQRDLNAVKSIKEHFISRYVERRWELDAFEMTNTEMDRFTLELERIKPTMILGYANALTVYAHYLLDSNPNHKIKLKGIISSAETLTEEKRESIEKAFKCKVLNRYGSREVGLIASECKSQEGLHINADNLYVEVLNGEKPVAPGESGDIVVTDFWNFGMPFIRYKLEDIGRFSSRKCSCGLELPLLAAVEGRTGDFFISNSGSMVHGEYFTHLFYDIPEVKKFQMVQESLDDIQLSIVEAKNAHQRDYLTIIEQKTKEMLGNQARITTHFVESIPPTASGKSLFTISKVSRNSTVTTG